MSEREFVTSVTPVDCLVQHFRAGGPGGQHQNKTSTAVRVIHPPSGARGESREERSQHENLRRAFVRMASTPAFRYWAQVQAGTRKSTAELLAEIDADLADPTKTRVEVRGPYGWQPEGDSDGGRS